MYYYQFAAFDSSGNQLSYSVENLPGWLMYDQSNHSISGKTSKAGQYPVHLVVSNGKTKVYQHFMLTVYDKKTVNILCLGNSITNGTSTFNSYRRDLWQMLHAGKYDFDLIGSWSKHHWGTEVPDPDFDMDHEGHSGWTLKDMFQAPGWDSIKGNINIWLQSYTPDIVLVELGTNDVFQCRKIEDILKDLSALIDVLRKKNSNVKIFVAQIPPLGPQWAPKKLCGDNVTYDERIHEFNKAIAAFVPKHTTARSPVIVVDQFTGIDSKIDQYDDIHPNLAGEKIMAERWLNAIKGYIPLRP